ncbi:acetylcholinesterase-1-like [Penaeus japonicus]|uniref:acetylcholinesterase-1-like n=1 Tax=Penaeus japonicus TaxID=27405 RepID=UPI001C7158CD|nr:acetylcholinesterase-1-like [Penaeus japonicus]
MRAVAVLMVLAWAVVAGEEGVAAPIVGTAGGEVSGLQEQSTKGKTFYSYYAIPFAQPPVGDLRFKVLPEWLLVSVVAAHAVVKGVAIRGR